MVLKHLKLLLTTLLISASSVSLGADLLSGTVYPIEPWGRVDPSGLTIKNGELYTVSDKNSTIYSLSIESDVAKMMPAIDFDAMSLGALNLDLEGITVVGDDFFLVSEAHHRMVRVQSSGEVTWVPDGPSFYPSAHQAGLFQIFNASLEAVIYLGEQRFLLAAERQPRGLIEVSISEDWSQISDQKNHVLNTTNHHLTKKRTADLTGLYYFKGDIFALHRNAELIHRWVKDKQGQYQEMGQWSFAHIVNAPEHQYQDMTYGHAEGLAVDDDHFYVVIDNNRMPKAKQGNDKRPLLMVLNR